jgi:hypothetical protein
VLRLYVRFLIPFWFGVSVRDVPQRLKPEGFIELYRRSKDLLHPAWDTVSLKRYSLSGVSAGVFGGIQDGPLDIEGARCRIAAAEDEDQILPAERLRHEFPSLAGLGVAAECSLHQRRWIELGFHGFHQIFCGVLRAAQARLFFFDFADLAVDLVARGFGKGIEKVLQAFGLAKFTSENRVDA